MAKQIIKRRGNKKNFMYELNGYFIKDKTTLAFINNLKIPPAWKDVEIAKNPNSKILCTGCDDAGRKQYIYHPQEIEKREKRKYDRMLVFVKSLPKIRRVTAQHLKRKKYDKQKVLATIVRIIDQAYFRAGNKKYAKENNSYGITTLRSRHLNIRDDSIIFNFEGKSGQKQYKKIKDKQLAIILKQLDEMPGYEIFRYYSEDGELTNVSSKELNDYLREISDEDITAKDFRTWAGTLITATALSEIELTKDKKATKRHIAEAIKYTAQRLGNTPAITRSSYIDPRIINSFQKGVTIGKILGTLKKAKPYLNKEEVCVLKLLEKTV